MMLSVHLRAMLRKKWLTSKRNKTFLCFTFVPPIAIVFVAIFFLTSDSTLQRLEQFGITEVNVNPSLFDPTFVPYMQGMVRNAPFDEELATQLMRRSPYSLNQSNIVDVAAAAANDDANSRDTSPASHEAFRNTLYTQRFRDFDELLAKLQAPRDERAVSATSYLLNDVKQPAMPTNTTNYTDTMRWDSAVRLNITVLYNSSTKASLPLSVNILSSALRNVFGDSSAAANAATTAAGTASFAARAFVERSQPIVSNSLLALTKLIGPIFISMALAASVGAFGVSLIDERESGLKMHLHMCGLQTSTYWLSHFIGDFIAQICVALLCLSVYLAARGSELTTFQGSAVLILIACFSPASILMSYCLSFAFKRAETAQKWFPVTINLLTIVSLMITVMLVAIAFFYSWVAIIVIVLSPFPYVGLVAGFVYIVTEEYTLFVVMCGGLLLGTLLWIALLSRLDKKSRRAKKSKPLESDVTWHKDSDTLDKDVKREARRILRALAAAGGGGGGGGGGENSSSQSTQRPALDDFVVAADLKKSYGSGKDRKLAVRGVSLGIKAGECLGLLGANGAGKSTLIKLLSGELVADNGQVWVGAHQMPRDKRFVYSTLGLCPQHDCLFPLLSGYEHLELFSALKHTAYDESNARLLGLSAHLSKRVGAMSGGTARKLSLAISLLGNPSVLYLDEPTAGMDAMARRATWDIINGLRGGRAILVTTHNMEEAEALCSRIAIAYDGRLHALGSTQHLKRKFGNDHRLELTTAPCHREKLRLFIEQRFSDVTLVSSFGRKLQFVLPTQSFSLVDLIETLEAQRAHLCIDDYAVCQETLLHVFLKLVQCEIN